MRIGAIIVLIWLLIGGFAAYQRDYFKDDTPDCKKVATIALNVVAGPCLLYTSDAADDSTLCRSRWSPYH